MTYNPVAEMRSKRGAANGYASLDANGKIPLAQLQAFVGTSAGHQAGYLDDIGSSAGTARARSETTSNPWPDGITTTPPNVDATNVSIVFNIFGLNYLKLYRITWYAVITTAGSGGSSLRLRFTTQNDTGDAIDDDVFLNGDILGEWMSKCYFVRLPEGFGNMNLNHQYVSGTAGRFRFIIVAELIE